jgi:predicted enzyme related to lactoylglutathione lyase
MTQGIRTVIYPVTDLARAKALLETLTGVKPSTDQPYYVGFNVDGQQIGLDPRGRAAGMTGPVCYWHVPDIRRSLQALLDAGATPLQGVTDVGGGKLIASLKDADGNVFGLVQPA